MLSSIRRTNTVQVLRAAVELKTSMNNPFKYQNETYVEKDGSLLITVTQKVRLPLCLGAVYIVLQHHSRSERKPMSLSRRGVPVGAASSVPARSNKEGEPDITETVSHV